MESGGGEEKGSKLETVVRKQWRLLMEKPAMVWFRTNLLLVLTVLGVTCGVILGLVGNTLEFEEDTVLILTFPGEIFMNMLKMLVLPLIVSSIIAGIAQLDTKSSGKMGSYTLAYYFVTTVVAAILGIMLVVVIRPGGSDTKQVEAVHHDELHGKNISTMDTVFDMIRHVFPENLLQACFQQVETVMVNKSKIVIPDVEDANYTLNTTLQYRLVRELHYKQGTNILGIIVFCFAFGLIASKMENGQGRPVIEFFSSFNEVIMKIVMIVIWLSPLGILCLIARSIMEMDDVVMTATQLGVYMATVILGLLIHGCMVLPAIYFFLTRRNPWPFFTGMLYAWVTALGTASSAATLPVTLRCLEKNNGVDKRVTRFVLPIGAIINMDGTALYEAVAAIFIAQRNGYSLQLADILTVCITATVASIGAASIPSAGLVTMLLVLEALGLPTKDIAIIVAVDWMLDRLRTSINVVGDAFGAGIVDAMCDLPGRENPMDRRESTPPPVPYDKKPRTLGTRDYEED